MGGRLKRPRPRRIEDDELVSPLQRISRDAESVQQAHEAQPTTQDRQEEHASNLEGTQNLIPTVPLKGLGRDQGENDATASADEPVTSIPRGLKSFLSDKRRQKIIVYMQSDDENAILCEGLKLWSMMQEDVRQKYASREPP